MKMKKFYLLCLTLYISLGAYAQATDLVINCQYKNQLPELISEGDQKTVRNLKVTGPITKSDLGFIGQLIEYNSLDGVLDLSECIINEIGGLGLSKKDSLRVYRIPKSATKVSSCAKNLYVDTLYLDCKIKTASSENIWWDDKNAVGKMDIGHLHIGEGVDSIGSFMRTPGREWAGACNSLKSVHLPSSVRFLWQGAFYGVGLIKHNFNDMVNLEYISDNYYGAFTGCPLDTIIIPPKLTSYPVKTVPYEKGVHVYIGENTKTFIGGPSNKLSSEEITFHINQKTPPNYSIWFVYETVYVPKGSKSAYENAGWGNVIEMNPVEKVAISEDEIVLDKGQKRYLSLTITPEDADDTRIKWTSENDSIATVNDEGMVVAINSGKVKVYATSIATGIQDSCLVTVRKNVESVEFEESQITLNDIGDTKSLEIRFTPSDATDKSVLWNSSNEQVCKVSDKGVVVAVGTGTAIITVTTIDGGHTATCKVKVLQHVSSLTLDKHSLSLKVGEKELVRTTILPENADNKSVTWLSSDNQIASVDINGNVTALKAGESWIKAVSVDNAEAKDSCWIKVVQPVTGVALSQDNIVFDNAGESLQLNVIIEPVDASNKDTRWSSSNENVCVVKDGLVTAIAAGVSTVTVTTVDGNYTASCAVKVIQHAKKVELNMYSISLKVGETERLVATVTPDNAEDKSVMWTSSDNQVVSVDGNGNVTALRAGESWIKAVSVDNAAAMDSCKITVIQPVTGVALSQDNITFDNAGESVQIIAIIEPADATTKEIRWSSSNENVCVVKDGLVTAVAAGTATITVTTVDGNFTASCVVKVIQHVAKVTLNTTTLSLKVGESERLAAMVTPDNAEEKSVTWTSSDSQVASVDDRGNVTALKAGEAWIKVLSVDNAAAMDSCKVMVVQPVTGIMLSQENYRLTNIGESMQLEATVLPDDATNKAVKWTSSNEAVCIVANGKVVATGYGTAVVMVTTIDGGFMASCAVIVEKETIPVTSVELSQTAVTLGKGETVQLTATVFPNDATNKNLIWKSVDETVCVATQTGLVVAIGKGKTMVIVVPENGVGQAQCLVTVEDKTDAISDANKDSENTDDLVYDLMGRKVDHVIKGRLYIRNGKVFVAQ